MLQNALLPYEGINSMLQTIHLAGELRNRIEQHGGNVRHALGAKLCEYFAFIDGIDNAPSDKSDAIVAALERLADPNGPLEAVYVDDTEKDWLKSSAVGVPFIGVDYGFEPLGDTVQ